MKAPTDKELKHTKEFLDKLMADPVKFERWANNLLDKAVGYKVGRRRRR